MRKRKWRLPMGQTRDLREAAYRNAMAMEPTPQFPGVDIDAVHHKRRKLKRAA
jgi:hypothetical protein